MIVTIDGPAGAGKSSVARQVAQQLGYQFLDTGAMYRSVALLAIENGVDWADEAALASLAEQLKIEFCDQQVLLDGRDVSQQIRGTDVTQNIHQVADKLTVRQALRVVQRRLADSIDVVTEGRDQGSEVFPQAECKVFLDASAQERARRRCQQLEEQGQVARFEEILQQQQDRDRRDASRPVGALKAAADALHLQTDGMAVDEVVDKLVTLVRQRLATPANDQAGEDSEQ